MREVRDARRKVGEYEILLAATSAAVQKRAALKT